MGKSSRLMGAAAVALSTAFVGSTFAVGGVAAAQDDETTDVIVVTGSQIVIDGNLVETSPVVSIGAEEFDARGTVRVEDLINTLPQAFGAQGSTLANGSTGTASLNLRGLDSERTLVLLNGRRLPYGSIDIYAPDINFIPAALIESVDVLTGGAAAIYGADAIAGVANFKLVDDFEGFRLDGNISAFQHNNDGELQDLLAENAANNPSQFRVPSGSTWEGETFDITGVFGGKFDNGRGGFTGFIGYQSVQEVVQDSYDYSQCALGLDEGEFVCSGSSTNAIANILDVDGDYAIPGNFTGNVVGEDFNAISSWARVNPANGEFRTRNFTDDTFNFNPFNHFQRPTTRYNAGFFTNYQLTDNVEMYSEFMFMDNRTNAQIAPSGVFGLGVQGDAGGINCDNPFLSAQQVDYLCTGLADDTVNRLRNADGDLIDPMGNVLDEDDDTFYGDADSDPDVVAPGPDGIAPVLLLRRNVEGGLRNQDIRHTAFRGTVGFRGEIGDTGLNYDVYGAYSNTSRSDVYNNDLSKRKIAAALYAVEDDEGNIVCNINADDDPTNDDAACVPYDIFTGNAPDPAAVAYIANPLNLSGSIEQHIVSGKISGSLAEYGVTAPWAEDSVAFAAGLEYRRDRLESNPDANYLSGDGAGQGGPTTAVEGAVEAFDIFVELNVPLIQGRPGIEQLGFDTAYRRSNYKSNSRTVDGNSLETDSYKFGLDYAPVEDIRFRGSYQRAVRVPNIFELFDANAINLFDLTQNPDSGLYDPCAGPSPDATFEQCARTGVTAAQYGTIGDTPAGQFNNLEGGNANLDPETSDTITLGLVFTPSAVPGLTVSLDYFDIEVEDFISTVPEEFALNQCLENGDPFLCGLINRGQGGTLWANQSGFITATNINTGALTTSGYDLLASYTREVGPGDLSFDYVGTYLAELEVKPLPTSTGDEIFDCAGVYGGRCKSNLDTGSNPEYRHRLSTTWTADKYSLTGTWRHLGSVEKDGGDDGGADGTFDAIDYFDLSGSYQARENLTLRLGVNNLFDQDPPLSASVGTGVGNGNTFPTVYDAMGRYVFLGFTADF